VAANNGGPGAVTASCGEAEAAHLAAAVRVPCLGSSFLSFVVMQHQWFRASVDPVALARAAAFAGATTSVRKDLLAHTEAAATASALAGASLETMVGPGGVRVGEGAGQSAAVVAAAVLRARQPSAKRGCSFEWEVDLEAVHTLYQDVAAAGVWSGGRSAGEAMMQRGQRNYVLNLT